MNAGGRQRAHRSNGRKEQGDDLFLFKELFNREKERNVSLLQPISDDFENAHGIQLYKIPSAKKGSGYDLFVVDGKKNDYNWLKTPPATPLFPSLEIEAIDPNMLLYQELSYLKPLKTSRFAGKLEAQKPTNRSKPPSSKSASSSHSDSSSSRSVTPNRRPTSSYGNCTATTHKEALNHKQRPNSSYGNYTTTTTLKEAHKQRLNHSISTPTKRSNPSPAATAWPSSATSTTPTKLTNPRSRGASPVVRSRIPSSFPGFSDETPPNLITSVAPGRAMSASRVRPVNPTAEKAKAEAGKPRRQSCSPSAMRGGRRAADTAGGNLVVGSRMVEKLMNARRPSGVGEERRDLKTKHRAPAPANEGAAFGRLMWRASLDMVLKHTEKRKGPRDQPNTSRAKSIATTCGVTSANPSRQTTPVSDARNYRGRRIAESNINRNGF